MTVLARALDHIRGRVAPPADADLLARFARCRDADAFAELVRRHGPLVRGVARRRLADPHAADDVVQATFLALARQAHRLGRDRPLAGWLFTVAHRLACKSQRYAARRPGPLPAAVAGPPADPLDLLTGRELLCALDDELARLSDRYRLPLVLCGLEGLSRDEAAVRLGWTLGSVRGRLERGRELLRRRLAARGLTAPAARAGGLLASPAEALPAAVVQTIMRLAVAVPASGGAGRLLATLSTIAGLSVGTGAALLTDGQAQPLAAPPVPNAASAPAVDRHGDPLPPGAVARLGTLRYRSDGSISHLVVLPDRRHVAFASGAAVIVMEMDTGKPVRRITRIVNGRESANPVTALAVAPDGRTLAVGCRDFAGDGMATITFWLGDATTGVVLREFAGSDRPVTAVAFVADGRQVAALDNRGIVGIWDAATGAMVRELKSPDRKLCSMAVSADGLKVAAGGKAKGGGGALYLWDSTSGELLLAHSGHSADVTVVAFAPDGRTLASGGNLTIRLWDVASGRELRQLRGHDGFRHSVRSLAVSSDGRIVASSGTDGTVRAWAMATGQPVDDTIAIVHEPDALAFRDARTLLIGSGPTLLLRDVSARAFGNRDIGSVWGVGFVGFAPDGRTVTTADVDSTIHVWAAADGRHLAAKQWSPRTSITVVSPNGRWVAITEPANGKDVACLGDVATGRVSHRLEGTGQMPATFSPDSRAFVTISVNPADGEKVPLAVWDVAQGVKLGAVVASRVQLNCLAIAPDGRSLFTAELNQPIRRWDVKSGRSMRDYSVRFTGAGRANPPVIRTLVVSRGGRRVVLGCGDHTVRLVDSVTGEECWRSQIAGRCQTEALGVSPEASLVATGYNNQDDRQIDLWDARNGKHLAALRGHAPKSVVHSLVFSPDGRRLASASSDCTALVWDVEAAIGRRVVDALNPSWQARLWDELGGTAGAAAQAMDCWQASPTTAVPFLQTKLRPVVAIPADRVAPLVAALDAPAFAVRENAARQLSALGPGAEPAMQVARKAATAEIRQRIDSILSAWTSEHRRNGRAVEVLEYIATPAARTVLTELAGGATGATLTRAAADALRRLEPGK